MTLLILADIVLALHLLLATLIAAGLLLIPLGGIRHWRWVRNRRLRLTHAALMLFIALEAILGLTCPLTILEYGLRQEDAPRHFLAETMERLLYWDAPPEAFILLYVICAAWALLLWRLIPPLDISKPAAHANHAEPSENR
ncbi:MAG: hypothetical protein RI968_409 [Pseudomonadota bacterium]|jgi:hypothetical protein